MLVQVDRHLRKLDQELAKFKMELEADNAGITEILERRELHPGLWLWTSGSELLTCCCPPPPHVLRLAGDGQSIPACQQPSCPLPHRHGE